MPNKIQRHDLNDVKAAFVAKTCKKLGEAAELLKDLQRNPNHFKDAWFNQQLQNYLPSCKGMLTDILHSKSTPNDFFGVLIESVQPKLDEISIFLDEEDMAALNGAMEQMRKMLHGRPVAHQRPVQTVTSPEQQDLIPSPPSQTLQQGGPEGKAVMEEKQLNPTPPSIQQQEELSMAQRQDYDLPSEVPQGQRRLVPLPQQPSQEEPQMPVMQQQSTMVTSPQMPRESPQLPSITRQPPTLPCEQLQFGLSPTGHQNQNQQSDLIMANPELPKEPQPNQRQVQILQRQQSPMHQSHNQQLQPNEHQHMPPQPQHQQQQSIYRKTLLQLIQQAKQDKLDHGRRLQWLSPELEWQPSNELDEARKVYGDKVRRAALEYDQTITKLGDKWNHKLSLLPPEQGDEPETQNLRQPPPVTPQQQPSIPSTQPSNNEQTQPSQPASMNPCLAVVCQADPLVMNSVNTTEMRKQGTVNNPPSRIQMALPSPPNEPMPTPLHQNSVNTTEMRQQGTVNNHTSSTQMALPSPPNGQPQLPSASLRQSSVNTTEMWLRGTVPNHPNITQMALQPVPNRQPQQPISVPSRQSASRRSPIHRQQAPRRPTVPRNTNGVPRGRRPRQNTTPQSNVNMTSNIPLNTPIQQQVINPNQRTAEPELQVQHNPPQITVHQDDLMIAIIGQWLQQQQPAYPVVQPVLNQAPIPEPSGPFQPTTTTLTPLQNAVYNNHLQNQGTHDLANGFVQYPYFLPQYQNPYL